MSLFDVLVASLHHHWSVVLRVILPGSPVLAAISRRLDPPVREGIVILGDPSNGEGLSFIPIPEFEQRWHDTDRHDAPRFDNTAVVLRVLPAMLRRMQAKAKQRGAPMFGTIRRNAVMYLP